MHSWLFILKWTKIIKSNNEYLTIQSKSIKDRKVDKSSNL